MCCWPLARNGCAQEKMLLSKREMHCLEDAWVNIQTQKRVRSLFHIRNSFTMKKGMLYVNTMPKGKTEGLLAFVVPSAHQCATLSGMHQDAGHQGQQRTLALAQECFWWPKMEDDCQALVRGCQHCKVFKGVNAVKLWRLCYAQFRNTHPYSWFMLTLPA